MSDRDALLRAIADNPADDTVRLAFADWLDEHGDPDRAAFIRLQIKLGDADRYRPPGSLRKLVAREKKMLAANQQKWLGRRLEKLWYDGFTPTFLRGFVRSADIHGRLLEQLAAEIGERCPVLEELQVVGVRGHGKAVARAACLKSVRTLRLEDWPLPSDAKAVLASPHLSRVEHLSVWLGSRNDRAVCKVIGEARHLRALKCVELIQLAGGLLARHHGTGRPEELAERADRLADVVNEARGKRVAFVNRAFDELFTLGPDVGRGVFGGVLPDGRQAVAYVPYRDEEPYDCRMFYFDADGRLTGGEAFVLPEPPEKGPRFKFGSADHFIVSRRLWKRMRFKPAMVRVREFDAEHVFPDDEIAEGFAVFKFDNFACEVFENPDGYDRRDEPWEESLDRVRFWLRSTNYCVSPRGAICWSSEYGKIHTT